MSRIYVTSYEVIGAGVEIAIAHYGAVDEARSAQWAFVGEVGGEGFRPTHNGGLRSVFFKELPSGWRKVGRGQGGTVEAVPHKGSAAGKVMAKRIAELPEAPRGGDLASALGFNPREMALDENSGTIYFPTDLRLSFPADRYFVRLPRFANDGVKLDEAILRELRESEFMAAVEDHNAEACRQKEALAA